MTAMDSGRRDGSKLHSTGDGFDSNLELPCVGWVVSCEHAGNRIPRDYRQYFCSAGAQADLQSHRGYDPGAIQAARTLARSLGTEVIATQTSRLVVDANRSLHNPTLFSKYMCDAESRQQAIEQWYVPYREQVIAAINSKQNSKQHSKQNLKKHSEQQEPPHRPIVHLSVHTFTPRFRGRWRAFEVGLLFDPARELESTFCRVWRDAIAACCPSSRVELNEPYQGIDDGFTTALRQLYHANDYLGIELELNHRLFKRDRRQFHRLTRQLAHCLPTAASVSTLEWSKHDSQ